MVHVESSSYDGGKSHSVSPFHCTCSEDRFLVRCLRASSAVKVFDFVLQKFIAFAIFLDSAEGMKNALDSFRVAGSEACNSNHLYEDRGF